MDEDKSIETLQTLLQDDSEFDIELHKAEKGGDNDDDNEDDEKEESENEGAEFRRFKKNFKRYMKSNPSECRLLYSEMKRAYAGSGNTRAYSDSKRAYKAETDELHTLAKAVDQEYSEKESDLIEADATIIDGTDMFKAFSDFSNQILDRLSEVSGRLEMLEQYAVNNEELVKASGHVLVKAASSLNDYGRTPKSVKGVINQPINNTEDKPLQKAMSTPIGEIKDRLFKAATSGNFEAGNILTQVESCYGNLQYLPKKSLDMIEKVLKEDSK